MNKRKQQAAFPTLAVSDHDVHGEDGMTLRDYFAAKAMQGIMAMLNTEAKLRPSTLYCGEPVADVVADSAYAYADAMLKARSV